MERRITIEVSYEGQLPPLLLEYLANGSDALVQRRSPLVIKTDDINVLGAIVRIARDAALPIASIRYRRAAANVLPAIA